MQLYRIFLYLCIKFKNVQNMEVNDIVTLISNLGFPIVVCIALFYYMNKQNERHNSETDKLSETVSQNTKVLTELCTLIKTLVK